jgi:acyl carrier protein
MSSNESKEIIRKYVRENTFRESNLIQDDTLLFQEGFFDSMGFVFLIDFIENRCKVKTSDNDLIEENFESINAISKFVMQKLNGCN